MPRRFVFALAALIFASPAFAGDLKLDKDASKLEFVGKKTDGEHKGGFKEFTVEVTPGDSDSAPIAKIELEIKTATIYSDDDRLTRHLKAGDFFNVNKYPKATFASTGIVAVADVAGVTHEITGDLTIRGVTHEVKVPVKVATSEAGLKITGEYTLDKKAFGMTYGEGKIEHEVPLTIELVLTK